MPYVICRVEKYTKAKTSGVANHHARAKSAYESNPDIDPKRSDRNVYFGDIMNIRQRVAAEIKTRAPMTDGRKRRKDAVTCFEVLISASPDWWPAGWKEMSKDEFKQTDGFKYMMEAAGAMNARFGKENFIGAAVHLDEATPHLSMMFTPIAIVDGKGKLCAKEVLSRDVLQAIQTQVGAIGAKYGLSRGVSRRGQDKAKHLTTEEYKAKAEITKIRKEVDATLAEYDKLRSELEEMKAENERLTKALERERTNLQVMLKATRMEIERLAKGLDEEQTAQVMALIDSFREEDEEDRMRGPK